MIAAASIAGGAVAAGAAWWAIGQPAQWRSRQVEQLQTACAKTRSLVLSFDDGPGRRATPKVLDLLAQHDAKATFFLVGDRARECPDVVDQLRAQGHEIGCHTASHLNAWRASPARARRDIAAGYDALAPWLPANGLFRPPYGKLTAWTHADLNKRGAPIGWWTIDSGDTAPTPPDVASIKAQVAKEGGGVVLLHDFDREPSRMHCEEHMLNTTRELLELAQTLSLRLVTLGQVLKEAA